MELGRSYLYKRAMAQQEKGGRTWRVVRNVVKHKSGQVTNVTVGAGLPRPKALEVARSINHPHP